MAETRQAEDIETLRRQAEAWAEKAEAAARTFDRATWVRFFLLFFPIPFGVLLFRLHLEAWHYYAAGALGIVFTTLLVVLDRSAMRKRDRTIEAAKRARASYDEARTS